MEGKLETNQLKGRFGGIEPGLIVVLEFEAGSTTPDHVTIKEDDRRFQGRTDFGGPNLKQMMQR